jgi:hypothetical protein
MRGSFWEGSQVVLFFWARLCLASAVTLTLAPTASLFALSVTVRLMVIQLFWFPLLCSQENTNGRSD